MERRLFDFFNQKFEQELDVPRRTMKEAFHSATKKIEDDLDFTPYSSFESFNALRKQKKKKR